MLAYQYMTAAHPEEAAQQYQDVLHLVPTDSVSRQMLALLNSTDDQPGPAPPATAPPANAGGPAVTSPRCSDGGRRPAPPTETSTCRWATTAVSCGSSRRPATQTFAGKFELAGNTLVLDYDNGGTMVAKVGSPGPERFTFQMVGGPPNDPGLSFARTR